VTVHGKMVVVGICRRRHAIGLPPTAGAAAYGRRADAHHCDTAKTGGAASGAPLFDCARCTALATGRSLGCGKGCACVRS
jgi:hypothetical protein